MSTRKRTPEEWPRMKVRGGRRRHEMRMRDLPGHLGRAAAVMAWAAEVLGTTFTAWQQHVITSAIAADSLAEEAASMHELGEELSVPRDVVERIITETRTQTPAAPTDWAIARTHLAALAGRTPIDRRLMDEVHASRVSRRDERDAANVKGD